MPSESHDIDRRTALTGLAAGGVLAAGGIAAAAPAKLGGMAGLSAESLGWDAAKGEYVLPPLPYDYEALEPSIDAATMRIHHDKHHAGYVKGLNKALAQLAAIREGQTDPGLMKHWSRELAFHGSGHVNHTIFWHTMGPADKVASAPGGDLANAIARDFGSYEKFLAHFKIAASKVEGSGWGWLVYHPVADKLLVLQAEKQQDMTIWGVVPLLGVDVWEHAYYLRYQNERNRYINAWINIIDWDAVGARYDAARA